MAHDHEEQKRSFGLEPSHLVATIPSGMALGFFAMCFSNGVQNLPMMRAPHFHLVSALAGGIAGYLYTRAYNHTVDQYEIAKRQYYERRRRQRDAVDRYNAKLEATSTTQADHAH